MRTKIFNLNFLLLTLLISTNASNLKMEQLLPAVLNNLNSPVSQDPKENFANFETSLLNSKTKLNLSKCNPAVQPTAYDQDVYVQKFNRLRTTVLSLIKSTDAKITGNACVYTGTDNGFTDASKISATNSAMAMFAELFTNDAKSNGNNFSRNLVSYTKCLAPLNTGSTDAVYIGLLLDTINNNGNSNKSKDFIVQFFNSYCSINNIFYFLKTDISSEPNSIQTIAKVLFLSLNSVKPNYDYLVNK